MKFLSRLFCVLALGFLGCAAITQDDFGYEIEVTNSLSTETHGVLHLRLLHQRENWAFPISTLSTLRILDSAITAFEDSHGDFQDSELDPFRYITLYVVDDNSSLWQDICWDRPNDTRFANACIRPHGWLLDPVGYMEPAAPLGWRPVQMAMIRHVYDRGFGATRTYVHEMMHILLYARFDDVDAAHQRSEIWGSGGAVERAVLYF